MNPYLLRLRRQYDELRSAIDTITTNAAQDGEGGRDLTDEELRSVEQMSGEAEALLPRINQFTEIEARHQQVATAAAGVDAADRDDQQHNRGAGNGTTTGAAAGERLGGATTAQDRDPGHYRSETNGGQHSFFADIVRAKEGDDDARTRLAEHNRALSTGVAGAGVVPPNWLLEEYEAIARQGRVLSAMVRRVPITNPAPMTLQRQTAGTDAVVAEQATENTHPSETDGFATTVDVVVPKPTTGIQVVARQMIDMASPAADLLIYGDMLAVYDRKVEDKVTAAWVAAAGTAVLSTTDAVFGVSTAGAIAGDAITDAAIAVWNARKLPADIVAMRVSRWGKFNKYRDTAGRKLYPTSDAGPMNVDGVGSVQSAGNVEGLAVAVTDGLGIGGATYPEQILVGRAADTILFEGAMQRFMYEEPAGPESVKLGIWAYTAVIVRQAAHSVRRITIATAT